MKRVVQVLHSLAGGGIENLLLSYLTQMNREGLHFDFVVYGDQPGALEPKFQELGCDIYRVPHRHDSLRRHCAELERILRAGHYDVVHSHQSEKGFITLRAARRCGIPTRILHVHNAFPPESAAQRLSRQLGAALGKRYATDWFACSRDAGLWLYGKAAMERGRVRVMPNAIDLDRFAFDAALRTRLRGELGLEGRLVIGCVARFTAQKNHGFLLDIFSRIHARRPEALLLLVGEGECRAETERRAEAMGLAGALRFLGVRTDVPALLQAMDAFLLPSRFEGLGIVFLEAQAAGLPTFGPDIPGARDTLVSPLMTALPLGETAEFWAERLLARLAVERPEGRRGARAELEAAGYDCRAQAHKLEEFYRAARESGGPQG